MLFRHQRREETTDLAGKFSHPDVHVKNTVHVHEIINHIRRVSGVNVQIHASKLAKDIVGTMPKDGDVIRYAPCNLDTP